MTIVYTATLKTNRMQLVADTISGKVASPSTGSASNGSLVIGTSALSYPNTGVLAVIPLQALAGTVTGNTFTISGTPLSGIASNTGTAAQACVINSANAVIISGLTVGTTGTDIILNATAVSNGQTVTLTSGSITHG